MTKNLIKRLFLGTVITLSLASCRSDFFNFIPKAILSAYQKQGSEDNPTLVIGLDGNDLNGKTDIHEYNVSITDNAGNVIETISETAPINREISMNDGTFYISGECLDSFGSIGEDGPIEITISRNNYLPIANLSATPTSGTAPLEVLIALDGTDENGIEDIVEYKVEIDNNEDGIIDETVTQDSPINIYKNFNTTTDVYGKCKDSKEAVSSVGPIKVTVNEPSPNPPTLVPNPPLPVFSISPTSGNVPLETIISISGTRTDEDIAGYKVWFDRDNDETIDDGEIIIDSSSPIINKKITITEQGTKRMYGICTDSNSLDGRTQLREVTVSPSTQPENLTETINFPNNPYSVGGRLTFVAQAMNNTTPLNSVTLDNSNHQSLEYKLLRKIGQGIYEEILDNQFPSEVKIVLNPPERVEGRGYIKIEQKDDDKAYLTIANAKIISPDLPFPIYIGINDEPLHSETSPNHIFEKDGNYILQTIMKYSVNGSSTKTLNFLSPEFLVRL